MGPIESTSLAHQRSVFPTNSAAARKRSDRCDSFTIRGLALVRSQDPARLPPASTALAGAGGAGGCFRECLIASLLPPGWESASLRTMRSAKKHHFSVHLAADYGPKRSHSNRLAGSCLTISSDCKRRMWSLQCLIPVSSRKAMEAFAKEVLVRMRLSAGSN